MANPQTIGLLGYGRIGRALHEYIQGTPDFELEYALSRSPKDGLTADQQLTDPAALADRSVDLCVEAATHEVLADLGERVLADTDLLVLSGSAFADPTVESRLTEVATANDTAIYLPHAALLGIDGLVDAREALETVTIEATKAPDHLDFSYTDAVSPADVDGRTVLYEGSVRGLCQRFPRNFNSHGAVAMASLGLDATRSTLIADPAAESADHVISAAGDGFDLEITRKSAIEGVTGDYTLISTWGSIKRILTADRGLRFI
ncbi:MAG: aspartate dehydrogenase domain-containing protein [Halobacteriales archaeon]